MIASIWETILKYSKKSTGKLGVSFKDLKTGEGCTLFGEGVFPSASVFKIYILAELFRKKEAGQISLEDRHLLEDRFKSEGSGVLRLLDSQASLTIKDYATLMMIISDNTATDFLFDLCGRDAIKEHVLDKLELHDTKCDLNCSDLIDMCYGIVPGGASLEEVLKDEPWMHNAPAYTGEEALNDETSPNDVTKMLETLYQGQWISPGADEELLEIMKQCQTNTRIPKYLPHHVEIAHKTGTMDRVANDVGIVYTDNGDYILAVFYNGNLASEEEYRSNALNLVGEEIIAGLSKEIYDIYTAK